MEQRGICTEYKTLEMIRREIYALNENQKTAPASSRSNSSRVQEGSGRGREVYKDGRQTAKATHDAWKMASIEAEDEETANTTTQGDREKGKEHKAGC